jgi:hypothetical protein
MNHIRIHRLLLAALAACQTRTGVAAVTNAELRAASALFQEFETVVDTKAALLSPVGAEVSKRDMGALQTPFAYLSYGLNAVGGRAASEIIGDAEAVLVGAKDFRPPSGLGLVRSQFCYVIVFREDRAFDFSRYFRDGPATARGPNQFWTWSTKQPEEPTLTTGFYATQIDHSYLLVSNGLSELQSVVKRLDPSLTAPPNLQHIPQWEMISQHPLWAYRRYQWSRRADMLAAGLAGIPPESEALILFLDQGRAACVLQLVGVPAASDGRGNITLRGELSAFESLGAGTWQSAAPLSGDEQSLQRLLAILAMLGFGLYL